MKHEPNERTRQQVQMLASYGFSPREIGRLLGHRAETIRGHYASELELGVLLTTAKVAARLYHAATRRSKPSVAAMIFWLKARSGWTPTSVRRYLGARELERIANGTVEQTGDDGWNELLDGSADAEEEGAEDA